MRTIGLYIHIPFCLKKCAYCDFYSITEAALRPPFVAALIKEIGLRRDSQSICDTLYFGGGTPSLLEVGEVERVLGAVGENFKLTRDAEITLEANPATISASKLTHLRGLGINRINIGIQSFKDPHLVLLGRRHNARDAHDCLAAARSAGFVNLGLDLIYGLPGQSEAQWAEDLEAALSYAPEHISCYMLTYEAGTPLFCKRQQKKIFPLKEEVVAGLFEFTSRFLTDRGYDHYEISNFARRDSRLDFRSRHNRKYWNLSSYLGMGPAAHSFEDPVRSWNLKDVAAYINILKEEKRPLADQESLTIYQQRLEAIYLGLRQSSGIDLKAFEKRFGEALQIKNRKMIEMLQLEKMAVFDEEHLRLTSKGMRYLDSIVSLLD